MASQLLAAAFSFNPVASLIGAVIASALWTRAQTRSAAAGAALVLVAAWAIADGVLLIAMLDRAASQGGADKPLLVAGGAAAFALGYALPTWTGVFVGDRVVKGTGWKSAAMVSLTASGALSAIASRLG